MKANRMYIGSFVVLSSILFALGFVDELNAEKSIGRGASQFGSNTKNIVCGDQLCSETGGKIIMPWEKTNNETDEENCLSSSNQTTCQNTDDTMMEEETTDDINQEIDEMKNSFNVNIKTNEEKLGVKTNVPVTIPLHQGYNMGKAVYYIITDSSNQTYADIVTKNQDWKVNVAPLLENAPKEALSNTYMFTNGIPGDGVYGFQGEIFTSTPENVDTYSPLTSHIQVTWDDAANPKILDSEKEMHIVEKQGLVTLTPLDVVLNMPQIVWPEGQMSVKSNKTLTNETPFVGGQILDIDLTNMTATFIARQGWDSNGKTIYYIVTDVTPIGPAISLGVPNVPKNAALISNSTVDMYHFMNGIQGPGPLGFQAGISSASPGDVDYSPMSRIYFIKWNDLNNTSLIQTWTKIDSFEKSGLISVDIARPMAADHIMNNPIIDPFQHVLDNLE